MIDQPLLLCAAELAQFLAISVRHLRRLNDAERIPKPVRIGHAIRWKRDEIERWVGAGCPNRAAWEAGISG